MTETAAPNAKPTANLDASSVPESSLAESAFPGTFQRDFRIHFEEKVHDEVKKHAAETIDVELCGVLIGKVLRDRDGPYLTISGAIRGEHAKHDGAQVTFTHDTWDHIHKEKDQRFPKETQIVGWYHTHPGFGIFLSGMDLFIHEFFFNGATQIAHVIDPRSGDEGVFTWRAGKVERAARFWIGSRERPCAAGPTGTRPMPQVSVVAPGSAAAATPRGGPNAPTREEKAEDELDVVGAISEWLPRITPFILAFLFGFLLAKFLAPIEIQAAQRELLRAEVRDLVGGAASAWASSEDLRAVEKRLADLSANPAHAASKGELAALSSHVATLRSVSAAREEALARAIRERSQAGATIEDDLRMIGREATIARRLATEAYLAALRGKVDQLAGRMDDAQRDALRQAVESVLAAEKDDNRRAQLRQIFPELYTQPADTKPQGPPPK